MQKQFVVISHRYKDCLRGVTGKLKEDPIPRSLFARIRPFFLEIQFLSESQGKSCPKKM